MKKMVTLTMLGLALLFFGPAVAGADYPEREVTVYCSSSAGGTTDLTIRYVSDALTKILGQSFVVVNKPGAAHTICANLVRTSKPDGYVLGGIAGSAFSEVPYVRKVPYDVRKDFTHLATCAAYTQGLTVKADAPWKTFDEFCDYAKKNPGKIIYSSDGHGGGSHIVMEYIAWKKGGIDWKHVPYSGGARNAPALLGGHVHAWSAAGTQVQFIKDGKMRMLVCYNEERQKYAPEVATLKELGYVDHSVDMFINVAGPKGLPEPIVNKLEAALLKAMHDPGYAALMDKLNMPAKILGAKDTLQHIDKMAKIWGEMVRVTGIKEEQ